MADRNRPAEYPGFKVGDRVRRKYDQEVGTIKFIGGDGTFDGEQLFYAKVGHAWFIPIFDIELIEHPNVEDEKCRHVRKFDESVSDVSDMKLKIGDETFYVSKLFLAGQSAYFKTMFLGEFAERNQSEVELKDIEPDVFHYFLEVLHGESVVGDDNVKQLLALDDMYDCETLRRRCLLGNDSKIDTAEKLHLSCRFKLPKYVCLKQVKTVADIRGSLPEDISKLDFNTVAELLQKSLNLH